MSEVIDLSAHRDAVWYTIRIGHHWDGSLEVLIEDVGDDPRSRGSVLNAMQRVSGIQEPADALHRELLEQINALMGATSAADIQRLARLADLVSAYEARRYPSDSAPA